jgi:hypothetical protein
MGGFRPARQKKADHHAHARRFSGIQETKEINRPQHCGCVNLGLAWR